MFTRLGGVYEIVRELVFLYQDRVNGVGGPNYSGGMGSVGARGTAGAQLSGSDSALPNGILRGKQQNLD